MNLIKKITFFVNKSTTTLTIFHQNIAGAINKSGEIEIAILESLKRDGICIDIICLCETFMKKHTEQLLKIDTFKLAASYSRDSKRGGTCILVKKHLEFKSLSITENLSYMHAFECCGIELLSSNLIVICLYRVPNSDVNIFFEKLTELLHNISYKKSNKKIVLCGDLNIDILKNNNKTQELQTILKNFNLVSHVNKPTRQSACLDLMISNIRRAKANVHYLALSDHETGQTLEFQVHNKRTYTYWYETARDYCKENVKKFCNCISSLSFSEIYETNNLNEKFHTFHELFLLFYDLCFPRIIVKRSNMDKFSNWITNGIRKSCVRKRVLYLLYRQSKANKKHNAKKYKCYSSLLKKCIYKAKILRHKKYINSNKNKCRATWNIINSKLGSIDVAKQYPDMIIYDNKKYSDTNDMCEIFNTFFIDITHKSNNKLTGDFNPSGYKYFNNDKTLQNSIFLSPVNEYELTRIIISLKNTNSVGYDGINTRILKLCTKFLCVPLCHIINASFEQGAFPSLLKLSVIKPLYKKNDPTNICNYRPVALIPVFSKIFEKAMLNRLHNYVIKNDVLKTDQFGFIKKSSTTLAGFNLIKEITNALNDKDHVAAIFLDMTRAFDYVKHDILLHKLNKYGIRGLAANWLENYLKGRKQCTEVSKVINNKKITSQSAFKNNTIGVPQGSILGPFLFLLYINDLPNVTKHKTILFADDTTIIIKNRSLETLHSELCVTLNDVVKWLNNNNLEINANKTKIIHFSTGKAKTIPMSIKFKTEEIEAVNKLKYLGLIIDQSCNWKEHILALCDKLDRFIYGLRQLKLTVSKEAALTAYHGYVSSLLSYGLLLWGNSVDFIKAFRVQKKAIRAICGAGPLDTCRPLFKELNVLPLPCMYIRDACLFVKDHPEYFEIQTSRSARRNNNYYLRTPRCHLTMVKKNAFVSIINIYNKLPNELKNLPRSAFKQKLNNWLMESRFYDLKEYFDRNI